MTKIITRTGLVLAIATVAAALLCVCSVATAAEKKAAPTAVSEAKKPEQKAPAATVAAEPGEEYAACSPDHSDKEILAATKFLGELSPELVVKVRTILLKCDFKVNDDLLNAIGAVQEEMAGTEFANAEQAKEFRQEKTNEIEIQIALIQKPVDQAELKKLVGNLFEIRQRSMKAELADLERQAELLKKRIEERQKLKAQITDRRVKDLVSGQQRPTEGEEPPHDPLSWD